MEFEYPIEEASLVGNVTIEIPWWLSALEPDIVESIQEQHNRGELLVAAGRHPVSRDIVAITGDGRILKRQYEHLSAGCVFVGPTGEQLHIESGPLQRTYQIVASRLFIMGASVLASVPTYDHETDHQAATEVHQ